MDGGGSWISEKVSAFTRALGIVGSCRLDSEKCHRLGSGLVQVVQEDRGARQTRQFQAVLDLGGLAQGGVGRSKEAMAMPK